jgi:pSer/pThr/pTyr-binding forkhead associated (FHA) protein
MKRGLGVSTPKEKIMVYLLLVVLVLLIGFIAYTLVSSKSNSKTPAAQAPSAGKSNSKIAASAPDDEEATQVRVAGPRLVRTIGGLKLGDDMPINGVLSIGRAQGCTYKFNDAELSSNHAEFRLEGGIPMVTDLGSTNGTFINGSKIEAHLPVPLKEGDQVKVGTIILIFKNTQ